MRRVSSGAVLDDQVTDPIAQLVHGLLPRAGEGEHGAAIAGTCGVGDHLVDVDLDAGRQVRLVDDQQVGAGNASSALAGDVRASPGCRSVATWRAACRRSSITYSPSTRPPTPRRRIGRSPPALLLGPRMDSYSTDTLEAFQAWTAAD